MNRPSLAFMRFPVPGILNDLHILLFLPLYSSGGTMVLVFFCLFPISIEPHATSFKTFLVLCHQTKWSSSSLCSRSPSSSQTSPEPSSIPKSFLSLVSSSVTVCNLFPSPSTIRDPLVRGRGRLRPSLVFFQRSLICFVFFFLQKETYGFSLRPHDLSLDSVVSSTWNNDDCESNSSPRKWLLSVNSAPCWAGRYF